MTKTLRIALLAPHIFMYQDILEHTVFAPATLLINLANELSKKHTVTVFTPGKIRLKARNIHLDLENIQKESKKQKCSIPNLIKERPLTFITLARQKASEIVSKAYNMANKGKFDIVHVFTLEDEIALFFASLVKVPVVFTHHDPYNMYARYKARFPRVKNLHYVSISFSQRKSAPRGMNFVANVYNGVNMKDFKLNEKPKNYFAFMGRIIKNKGCHTAISACKSSGNNLRIAGKHYQGHGHENYWAKYIEPNIDEQQIEYSGFIGNQKEKNKFLGQAKALLFPIQWDEPFGMVMVEANACGTPVIAFDRGAVSEIIKNGVNGFIVKSKKEMVRAMKKVDSLDRRKCREYVEKNFSVKKMVEGYEKVYLKVLS